MKRLFYGNTYCAVEHSFDGDQEQFSFLQLLKKKNELIVKKRKNSNLVTVIIDDLKEQEHLFLIINNQQVLSKEIAIVTEDAKSTVQKAFPNIVLDNFYYETYSNKHTTYVSICRKEYVDTLITMYLDKGIHVLGFSLGNLAVKELLPYVSNTIYTTNALIEIAEKEITGMKKGYVKSVAYNINDLEVSSKEVLSLAGILLCYISHNKQLGLQKSFQQKKLLAYGVKAGLALLFCIVLLNVIFYNQYHTKVQELSSKINNNQVYTNKILQLQKEVVQKETLLLSLNSASSTNASKYLDEVVQVLPNTMLLKELYFQPLKGRVKKDKSIKISYKSIVVKGTITKETDFMNFVSELEKKNWIDNVLIVDYGKQKGNTHFFEFLISIK